MPAAVMLGSQLPVNTLDKNHAIDAMVSDNNVAAINGLMDCITCPGCP